jgi:hypothetical protein
MRDSFVKEVTFELRLEGWGGFPAGSRDWRQAFAGPGKEQWLFRKGKT